MRRHTAFRHLAATDRGAAVAIGNFDGVHLGHQSVLALARAAAAEHGAAFGVVTFEPHPRAFFNPDAPAFRLMTTEARARRMEKLGVEQLYELPFDAALAALGPAAGFEVTAAPLVSHTGGDVSSTAIRSALTAGRPEVAARMLGHWHRIEGRVQRGDQRGRELGFPTANLGLDGLHLPRLGVYAVFVDVLDGPHRGRHAGAASIGERPTFGRQAPNLEVHLLDFAGDLYGAALSVALVAFQRPELTFDSAEALIARMRDDVAEARAHLARTEAS